jgi:hypothetical protein
MQASRAHTPIAHTIAAQGINLPSYFDMSLADIDYICKTLTRYLAPAGRTVALPSSPIAADVLSLAG